MTFPVMNASDMYVNLVSTFTDTLRETSFQTKKSPRLSKTIYFPKQSSIQLESLNLYYQFIVVFSLRFQSTCAESVVLQDIQALNLGLNLFNNITSNNNIVFNKPTVL